MKSENFEEFMKDVRNVFLNKKMRNKKQEVLDHALFRASRDYRPDFIKRLIKEGASVDICDNLPIRQATKFNDVETINLLLDLGADINVALFEAAKENNTDMYNFLIEKGADLTVKRYETLHIAISKESWDVLALMVETIKANEKN